MQKSNDISALLWLIYEKDRASLTVPEERKRALLDKIRQMTKDKER